MTQRSLCLILLAATLSAVDHPRFEQPTIVHVGAVDRDILAVEISTDGWIPTRQERYQPQPGDEVKVAKLDNGYKKKVVLIRDGKEIGHISGAADDWFTPHEQNVCPALDEAAADRPATWRISSSDDPAFAQGVQPQRVMRKSKQSNWNNGERPHSPTHHFIYLKLPTALTPGKRYSIRAEGLALASGEHDLRFDPERVRSEAVHVTQTGFRPDDPGKRAYLSIWLGTGGAHRYAQPPRFRILDAAGTSVVESRSTLALEPDQQEYSAYGRNAAKTAVYHLDFELATPGEYRIVVEGIGCSAPFRIAADSWQQALVTSLRGFFHQRSGIAIGQPHSSFDKPRDLHPADGVQVFISTFDTTRNQGGQNGVFKGLLAGKTEQTLTQAWGGYHDAGDWDRRIQHLDASYRKLELLELFPQRAAAIATNIPESGNALPDILDEALWNLDCYRRLQTPEGGIRHGIESAAHPREGEPSWRESLPVMVFAPDVWSSYIYAATAAKAAGVLASYDQTLASSYRESALRAMAWAEAEYPAWQQDPATEKKRLDVRDRRNLAALELYRLSGEQRWHQVFLEDTAIPRMQEGVRVHKSHDQGDAAFLYTRLPEGMGQAELRQQARAAILKTADDALAYQAGMAYDVCHSTKFMPRINGFFSAPKVPEIARAHHLSGDERYLRALVRACQFGLGANPMNMPLTTGIGWNPPLNPLHIDSRETGQPAPAGLTLYGNNDLDWMAKGNDWGNWAYKWFFDRYTTPKGSTWPTYESYFDVGGNPSANEFTIMGPMEYACYSWGYLALRD